MTSLRTSRPLRRGLLLAATLLGSLLAAGCQSDDSADPNADAGAAGDPSPSTSAATTETPTTPATSTDDPVGTEDAGGNSCDIVSDEIATQVLGIEIVRREPHTGPHGRGDSCIKGTARGTDPSKFSFVSVSILPGGGARVLDDAAAQGAEAVPGLGDRAVYLADVGGLFIVDGDDAIQVQVVQGGKPGNREDDIIVAEDVLGRRG